MTPRWGVPLPAPAKLNLFLHVLGRRADGRHDLQSVFHFINWCDALTFHPAPVSLISWHQPVPELDEHSDLSLKAARLLLQYSGAQRGVRIALTKNIPIGAGLGGGSSDAALALWALNSLWELHLASTELQRLALQLGADVPFFLAGANAWAEGIGDELTPLILPPTWYVLLVSPQHVATAEIFNAAELRRNTPPSPKPVAGSSWNSAADFGHNDLQPVTCARYPQVASLLAHLQPFGPARMSGSGGAVFVPLPNRVQALQVARQLPADLAPKVVEGLPSHPTITSP